MPASSLQLRFLPTCSEPFNPEQLASLGIKRRTYLFIYAVKKPPGLSLFCTHSGGRNLLSARPREDAFRFVPARESLMHRGADGMRAVRLRFLFFAYRWVARSGEHQRDRLLW